MARLATAFNAQDYDTTQADYSELPNGIYELEIEASEVAPTKDGTGTILKTTNVVIRPEQFAKRKLFNNFNLENKSVQAQEIGQRQFASLCRAIGVSSVEDSDELHFKTYTVRIGLGKPSKDGQYPARAEIKKFFSPTKAMFLHRRLTKPSLPLPVLLRMTIGLRLRMIMPRRLPRKRTLGTNVTNALPVAAAAGRDRRE